MQLAMGRCGLLWQRGRITLGGVIQNIVRPKLDGLCGGVDSYSEH